MTAKEDFLLHMGSHPLFPLIQRELEEGIPPIPEYNPDANNVEDWKYLSAQRAGYLLCLAKLGISLK